jgi:hypothetical protein
MSRSDEISEYILSRIRLTRERVKQILHDLESISDELAELYNYAMDHDMENIADEISIVEFDLAGALAQVKGLMRELMVLEQEVEEDEQEE